jgi:hypothetical protein
MAWVLRRLERREVKLRGRTSSGKGRGRTERVGDWRAGRGVLEVAEVHFFASALGFRDSAFSDAARGRIAMYPSRGVNDPNSTQIVMTQKCY